MASVLKLRLQGVRAFDNYSPQELEFSTPLTLICGQNGVGKTTIIEALSYVTTGALPPNAKGGAFVHDPSMTSKNEVLAQVKLLYTDSQSHRMVATRSMRLSVSGKGKPTFKTLEGQLKVYGSDGETGAVSSRYADLNTQIPLSLGVPAPILNFVIFCHQEDSLWPLSEPSIVKKRFDEIFEATKYSKALESLKTIHKEYSSGLRVDKVNVDHLEADLERVKEKRQMLVNLNTRVNDLNAACEQIQNQRKQNTAELNNLVASSQYFKELEYELKDIQRLVTRLAQDAELLKLETKIMTEPSESLKDELRDWDTRSSQLDSRLAELSSRRQELDADAESIRQNLAVLSNQQGRIEQALEARDATLQKRAGLAGESTPHQYRRELEKRRTELDENINEIEVSHRQREAELSQSVSAQEAKVLALKQTAMDRRNAARDADTRVNELQAQIDAYDREHAITDLQYLKTSLADLEVQTDEARHSVAKFIDNGEIEAVKSQISEREHNTKRARSRLQEAIEVSSVQSRLLFLRDSLREIEVRKNSSLEQIGSILDNPSASSKDAETAIKNSQNASLRADENCSNLESHLKASRAALSQARDKSESLLTELQEIESALTLSPTEFENVLNEAEEDVVVTTENREQAAFAQRFFSEAVTKAKGDVPVCLLCDHHQTRDEADAFISRLISRIKALPMSPEQASEEAESARKHVETIRSQAPQVQRWHQIKSELSNLEEVSTNANSEVSALLLKKNKLDDEAKQAHTEYERLSAELSRHLTTYSRSLEDARNVEMKIETEASILSHTETESPQQAQEALDKAESLLGESRAQLESLREHDHRQQQRLQSLEQRVSNLRLRISEHDLATTKRQQAEQAQKEARSLASRARSELSEAQYALPEAERVVTEAQTSLRSMKHEFATIERELVQQRSSVVDAIRLFDSLEHELDAFEAQYGSDPLGRIETERTAMQAKKEEVDQAVAEVIKEITRQERMQADLGSHQRRLRDNLRLRRIEQELSVAREKKLKVAEKHRESLAHLGDYEHHITMLQEELSSANADIATKKGEAKAMSEQMRQLQQEIVTTYGGTEEQYHRAVAQLQSNEGATKDLVKYVRALDDAIMRYHSLKMAEINSLLDELWKRTYTGTDIDTILVRSESDVGSKSTRASYNYRVCMVKQDIELDMRGRCSAGQKVLASILIRMALAECFGNNLGLIVLDEPTTNLDHENIIALAQSLSDIIASRQAQRNFQLIVITHDEHFLTQMNPANHCSWYYRIERNERQLSVIKRLPISSLS